MAQNQQQQQGPPPVVPPGVGAAVPPAVPPAAGAAGAAQVFLSPAVAIQGVLDYTDAVHIKLYKSATTELKSEFDS